MKTATTKAVEAKQMRYMRLENASTLNIIKSLWKRLDSHVYVGLASLILGLVICTIA